MIERGNALHRLLSTDTPLVGPKALRRAFIPWRLRVQVFRPTAKINGAKNNVRALLARKTRFRDLAKDVEKKLVRFLNSGD